MARFTWIAIEKVTDAFLFEDALDRLGVLPVAAVVQRCVRCCFNGVQLALSITRASRCGLPARPLFLARAAAGRSSQRQQDDAGSEPQRPRHFLLCRAHPLVFRRSVSRSCAGVCETAQKRKPTRLLSTQKFFCESI